MKRYFTISTLTLSLVVAAAFVWRLSHPSHQEGRGLEFGERSSELKHLKPTPPPPFPGAAGAARHFRFASTNELPSLIAKLREAGLDDLVIRDILRKMLMERNSKLGSTTETYWKSNDDRAGTDAQLATQERAREADSLLSQLGLDDPSSLDRFSYLPPEKQAVLAHLNREWDQRIREIESEVAGGAFTREQLDAWNSALEQRTASIRGHLTDEEWFEWQLREGEIGRRLRGLAGFDWDEQAFREVARIELEHEQRPVPEGPAQESLSQQREQELKHILGDQRFEDYVRAEDSDYLNNLVAAQRIAGKTGYTDAKALGQWLYDVRRDFDQAQSQMLGDPAFNEPDVSGRINELRLTYYKHIQETLREGFEDYLDSTGQWLNP